MDTLFGKRDSLLAFREWMDGGFHRPEWRDGFGVLLDWMLKRWPGRWSEGMADGLRVLAGREPDFTGNGSSFLWGCGLDHVLDSYLRPLTRRIRMELDRGLRWEEGMDGMLSLGERLDAGMTAEERRENDVRLAARREISMAFDGTLVITDPGYLREGLEFVKPDGGIDFDAEDSFADGIRGIQADTIYGDWSCGVFEAAEPHGLLGRFCADGSMVCVTTMEDVDACNPHFREWAAEHGWCVAVIPGFKGTVSLVHDRVAVAGDGGETHDDFCMAEGHGTVDFVTRQTGL